MKRKKAILLLSCVLCIGLVAWRLPILLQKSKAKPLQGYFGSWNCACGHENFYELVGNDAFEICPGHRERKHLGKVIRTKDTATVISPKTKAPTLIFTYDGTKHFCDLLYSGSVPIPFEQINNPWRTVLPKYLPEDGLGF
ncbi:MAG: hypothetical protein ACSHX9_06940 [Luteolibacter sp.]